MNSQLELEPIEQEQEEETEGYTLEETVRLSAQGNTERLYALCKMIARGVLFHTTHILGNQADAEDVSQEVLLRVCEKIGGLRNPATFPAWLGKIVTNEANRYLTKNLQRGIVLNIDDYLASLPEDSSEFLPHEYAENEEFREFVVQTIDSLPQRQREAVLLHYYNGLNVSETAKTMGMSQAGVSQYLALARKKLRRELERHPSGYSRQLGTVGLGALMSAVLVRHAESFRLPENAWMQKAMARCRAFIEESPPPPAPKPVAAKIAEGAPSGFPLRPVAGALAAIAAIFGVALGSRAPQPQATPQEQLPAPTGIGYIYFTGGETPAEGAAHINPTRAQAFANSEYGDMEPIEWRITQYGGIAVLASGTGGVVDEEFELLDLGEGQYQLVFRLKDPSGRVFRLGSNFVVGHKSN
jgi:RNA polymerase sigma-70 factor (ECF subfamily)